MLYKRKFLFLKSSSKLLFIAALAAVIGLPGVLNLTGLQQYLPTLQAAGDSSTEIWWPTNESIIKGTQPLKAILQGKSLSEYKMSWKVDGGQLNEMYDSQNDYPHKEAMIDVSSWTWKGSGPYTLTFVSKDNSGNQVSQKSIDIYTSDIKETTVVSIPSTATPDTNTAESITEPVKSVTPVTEPVVTTTPTPTKQESVENTSATIDVWWPHTDVSVSGVQPLKAMVKNQSVENYVMNWQVDGGRLNSMSSNYEGYPHKETNVDLTSWTWKGVGPYKITFVAKDNRDRVIAKKDITIYNSAVSSNKTEVSTTPTTSTNVTAPAPIVTSPVTTSNSGKTLYVDPNNPAKRQANEWRSSRPYEAGLMDKIGSQSGAVWIGNWNGNVESDVRNLVTSASSQNAVPVLVAYNMTNRDCGSYSAGGAGSADAYKSWIRSVARGIGDKSAIVILEPDAVAGWNCLNSSQKDERAGLIADAVNVLKANGNTKVYVDGGNPTWISADEMANRLKQVNIDRADGFSLNVSNFYTTDANTLYGQSLSSKLGGKHFIIDTSRNGNGSNGEWCNPSGRAIGNKPTLSTGNSLIDGYLWLKVPGESDGNCNGGPNAGHWWADYAVGISQRASW